MTYEVIGSFEPTGVGSVTFSNIPQTYLNIILVAHTATNDNRNRLIINGQTGAYYDIKRVGRLNDNNNFTFSDSQISIDSFPLVSASTGGYYSEFRFNNYNDTTSHKAYYGVFSRPGTNTDDGIGIQNGNYKSDSAITSIEYNILSGTFLSGSVVTLYGEA